jgi:hypothetical protein
MLARMKKWHSFTVSREMHAAVKQRAAMEGVSMSAWVRGVLDEMVRRDAAIRKSRTRSRRSVAGVQKGSDR